MKQSTTDKNRHSDSYQNQSYRYKARELSQFNNQHRGSFGGTYQSTEKKSPIYFFNNNNHHKYEYDNDNDNDNDNVESDNKRKYLDSVTTPLKFQQNMATSSNDNMNKNRLRQSDENSKYRQILYKLDQTQEKLVISQKKYGQLWRKYQQSCESIKLLNKQINRLQQKKLKQMIEYQNKFRLLEDENAKIKQNISGKQTKIVILNSKIQEKTLKVDQLEKRLLQLQDVMNSSALEVGHRDQVNKFKEYQIQQRQKSYQRQLLSFKQQISRLQDVIEEDLIEKGRLISEIEVMKMKQKQQFNQYNQQIRNLQEEYKKWLGEEKQEKLRLIEEYEEKLNSLSKNQKLTARSMSTQLGSQSVKNRQKVILKQQQIGQKVLQINKLQQLIEKYKIQQNQLQKKILKHQNTIKQLTEKNDYLTEYKIQLSDYNRELAREKDNESEKYSQFYYELQNLKNDFKILWEDKVGLERKCKEKDGRVVELEQLSKKYEEKCQNIEKGQLGMNCKITQANKQLQSKILSLTKQNDELTRELFAERLQSVRLKQQVQQQAATLKYEYQLSLQNVQKQLSNQIKAVQQEKSIQIIEKEKIYVEMRELERKYELLISEMLTVDDMMAIATKVHKRHSKFVKGEKQAKAKV